MSILLGAIADDYTGASDLGAMLSRAGMRVLLVFGLPEQPLEATDSDAVIIALKSRSIPADEAVDQSLQALRVLQSLNAKRYFFKYCSTFDSTDEGNIGPVADALASALGVPRVLFCPGFPENGRTVYCGYLFVHGELLHESGMRNHPVNPMTDANLLRVLGRQTERTIGLLPYTAIDAGVDATSQALRESGESGAKFLITDSLHAGHLRTIASAIQEDVFVTGGSAIGQALAEVYLQNARQGQGDSAALVFPQGPAVVLAGSCSQATQRQVAAMKTWAPSCQVDPLRLATGEQTVDEIVQWALGKVDSGPVLVYTTDDAETVTGVHQSLGQQSASRLLEDALGRMAAELAKKGVRRLVVAGGETSGAVMRELGCTAVWIGDEIAPGVPWVLTREEPRLALALKSGNFGSDQFFREALQGTV